MTQVLAHGWASGPARHLSRTALNALVASPAPPTFPPHTRMGLLEHLQPPQTQHTRASVLDTTPGFVAIVADLTAYDVLALLRLKASGVVLTGQATRHAIVAARAIGLPVVHHPQPYDSTDKTLQISPSGTVHLGSPQPLLAPQTFAVLHEHFTPVLPHTLLHTHTAPLPWLELMSGQTEERHLACSLAADGMIRGVGLLRLEFLVYTQPDLDQEALTEVLQALLNDFIDIEVHIRLTDWSSDKQPPSSGLFQDWNGARGIGGIVGTRSLEAQLSALCDAQTSSQHPSLRIIAPYAEDPALIHTLAKRIGPERCIAMIESSKGAAQMEQMLPSVWGFWVGLGDLSLCVHNQEELHSILKQIQRTARGKPLAMCGLAKPTQHENR